MLRTMKYPLITLAAVLVITACNDEPPPKPPAEPPPAQPAPKGTSIEVDEDGVKVESKDADVRISEDSARIELPPKK